ncbi:UNVERIFIED_CONTAM: hypothetical protein K2H54_046602 [Gekko kuhli]
MEEASRLLAGLQPPSGDPPPHRLQAPPGPPQPQAAPGLQDTGDILQQIMAITDQSLDEAQARQTRQHYAGYIDHLVKRSEVKH